MKQERRYQKTRFIKRFGYSIVKPGSGHGEISQKGCSSVTMVRYCKGNPRFAKIL